MSTINHYYYFFDYYNYYVRNLNIIIHYTFLGSKFVKMLVLR